MSSNDIRAAISTVRECDVIILDKYDFSRSFWINFIGTVVFEGAKSARAISNLVELITIVSLVVALLNLIITVRGWATLLVYETIKYFFFSYFTPL